MRTVVIGVGLLLVSCADAATQCRWARENYQKAEMKLEDAKSRLSGSGSLTMADVGSATATLTPLVAAKEDAFRERAIKCMNEK